MYLKKLKNLLIIDINIVNLVSAQKIDVPQLYLTQLGKFQLELITTWQVSTYTNHKSKPKSASNLLKSLGLLRLDTINRKYSTINRTFKEEHSIHSFTRRPQYLRKHAVKTANLDRRGIRVLIQMIIVHEVCKTLSSSIYLLT